MFNYHIRFKNNSFLIKLITLLIISLGMSFTVLAQDTINQVKLSPQEQTKLNQGQVVLKGSKGKYVGEVIATGNINTAWEVLTDYNNFRNFLPNVSASRIVKSNGDRKIFEQVNKVDLFFYTQEYTVQIESSEVKPQKITFKLYKGDLKHLSGSWQIKKINANKIMVIHTVDVVPKTTTEKAFFYGIYESSIEKTLAAIATEVTKRSRT